MSNCIYCGEEMDVEDFVCEGCEKLTHFEQQILRLLSEIAKWIKLSEL